MLLVGWVQLYFKKQTGKLIEKIRFMVTQRWEMEGGKWDEGSQKV